MSQYDKYYKKFDILFGVACGIYLIFMFYRIACQVNFDIFFVDWEHDKEIFSNTIAATELETEIKSKYLKYRGAWRLLHSQINLMLFNQNEQYQYTLLSCGLYFYTTEQEDTDGGLES